MNLIKPGSHEPEIHAPAIKAGIQRIEKAFAGFHEPLNVASNDIRRAEKFLQERKINVPFSYIFRQNEPTQTRHTHAISWEEYDEQGYRLLYVEEKQIFGAFEVTGKPVIECKTADRLDLYSHLGTFLEKFADHLLEVKDENQWLVHYAREKGSLAAVAAATD